MRTIIHVKNCLKGFLSTILLTLFTATTHAEKVVIIPLLGGEVQKISNVVTVAKSGGDYTDPLSAVNSIKDASETKPYLVFIAPGIYNLDRALTMKPHVSVRGSGSRNTILTGSISGAASVDAALVLAASESELSNLTMENIVAGDGNRVYGAFAQDVSQFFMKDVVIRVKADAGSSFAAGFVSVNSNITFDEMDVSAGAIDEQTPLSVVGVLSTDGGSGSYWSNMMVRGVGFGLSGVGIQLVNSSPTITNSEIIGRSTGIFNFGNSKPRIESSIVSALSSDGIAVSLANPSARIIKTQVREVVSGFPSTTQCKGVYNEDLEEVSF